MDRCYKVSPELPLLQVKKPQLSLSVLPNRQSVPALWSFLQPSSRSVLRGLCLSWSGDSRAGCTTAGGGLTAVRERHRTSSLGLQDMFLFMQKDTIVFLDCERTLLVHVWFFIHQHPQAIFQRAAQNPFIPQTIPVLGIILSQVQCHPLGLVEFHEVFMDPSFRHVRFGTQLGVTSKFAEAVLSTTTCVTGDWSLYPHLEGHHSEGTFILNGESSK